MKRLLLAPLLITLLVGCSSKNDSIINLKCPAKYISIDDGPYKPFALGGSAVYLITINTKTNEGVLNEETASGLKVLVDLPIDNLKITKDKIVFDNLLVRDNGYSKTEFTWSYSINRVNGEVIRESNITYFVKDKIINRGSLVKQKGECYSLDNVETLF